MKKVEIILGIALGLSIATLLVIVLIVALVYFFPDLIISAGPPTVR